eukprot:4007535-Ditylum_brightwellii.AAC.1
MEGFDDIASPLAKTVSFVFDPMEMNKFGSQASCRAMAKHKALIERKDKNKKEQKDQIKEALKAISEAKLL